MAVSPNSTTIRISTTMHKTLKEMAREQSQSMQDILNAAIARYQQYMMIQQLNEDYAALRKDKKAWKEEIEERKLWDNTLMDGLEDD